jgi:hypothetical protein
MQRAVFLFFATILVLPVLELSADPPSKADRTARESSSKKNTDRGPSRAQVIASANGWVYVNGEWVHPDGYKFVNNKVLRTTARTGQSVPKPPGKLALENPTKLTARPRSAADEAKAAAEKAAETRRKNLIPIPAPQTGTHL